MPSLKRIAALARERREAEGLSQKDLASLAGVHHTVVIALEKGTGHVRFENAWTVLGVLGLLDRPESSIPGHPPLTGRGQGNRVNRILAD
ncbi:helix-turn-helix domain-containing protein [Azospirillum doebereinerae]|uniref:helix-turn-helix domain-containing protein n=2 Tax=Azospirillum doebereinerae TaxID=92933 RepID=UPI00163B88E4|nr:helix-turn-helix domain-containing protein [Azospirillum doebereinerae]